MPNDLEELTHGRKIVARFEPKDTKTLRRCMRPYVGQLLELEYCGTGGDDEPYPGQRRWMTRRSFEERIGMDREARGRWLPEEDLADIQPLSLTTNKKHTETANNE